MAGACISGYLDDGAKGWETRRSIPVLSLAAQSRIILQKLGVFVKETEFDALADAVVLAIEAAIDASGADIDCELSGGVLILTCENNASKIILSRQPALEQIWLAAKSGGYHFNYCDGVWLCTAERTSLPTLLSRVCSEQTGSLINLNF